MGVYAVCGRGEKEIVRELGLELGDVLGGGDGAAEKDDEGTGMVVGYVEGTERVEVGTEDVEDA